MSFQPLVNDALEISGTVFRVAEHPAAPGLPYGQQGRQATVYQLTAEPAAETTADGPQHRALKVFKARFRLPAMVALSDRIAPHASLPGLTVCQRQVLTPNRNRILLHQHPDLVYAVLMPWIVGPTWFEVMAERRPLRPGESLLLARGLATTLSHMEERGLAHCDLSGPNVLLPGLADGGTPPAHPVELVDVESLFGSGLDQPAFSHSASPGYVHLTAAGQAPWQGDADRFSGAIILAEMLGWCDERVRSAAWGESFFQPDASQRDNERFRLLVEVLEDWWGSGVARLLDRAWHSDVLAECATFGEWLMMLPDLAPTGPTARPAATVAPADVAPVATTPPPPVVEPDSSQAARTLLDLARQVEQTGNRAGALAIYRQALGVAPAGSELAGEIADLIRERELPATPPVPRTVSADREPDMLFDDALVAYQAADWHRAQQLLRDVLRREPDYQRDGRSARDLLAEVERHLAPPPVVPVPTTPPADAAPMATGAQRQTMTNPPKEEPAVPVAAAAAPARERRRGGMLIGWGLGALVLVAVLIGVFVLFRPPTGPQPTTVASAATPTSQPVVPPTLVPIIAATAGATPTASPPPPGTGTPTATPGAATAGPTAAPTPGQKPATTGGAQLTILYSSHQPDVHDSQIWRMNADGTGHRQLTFTRGHSWAPRLAPDSRRFLFSSVAPGAHTTHDPTGGGTTTNPGNHDIYVASADGANIENLTARFNAWDNGWAWSPDGKWIAFASDRDGNWELYKMDVTGETIVRLTNHPKSDGWPSWTPDGKSLVFASDRSGNWEVFIMNENGSQVRQLTERVNTYDTFPAVSPDGKKIAFSSQFEGRKEGEIYVMNIDGSGITRLTSTVAMNNLPNWCPDGAAIVFVSDRTGNDDIWIMNADGANPRRLTTNPGEDTTPNCALMAG